MKALTLHQPWAWAVAHAGKPVENRTWAPPARLFGQRIAIHAGKRYCPEAAAWMYEHGVDVRDPRRQSTGVVAVATVRGAIAVKGSSLQFNGTLDEHCVGEYADSFWFEGPVGWCLDRVIALPEPVPCRGAQGLWTLPEDAERSVRAQTAEVANG